MVIKWFFNTNLVHTFKKVSLLKIVQSWEKLDLHISVYRQLSLNKMAHEQFFFKSKRFLAFVIQIISIMSNENFLNCLTQMFPLYYYTDQIYGAVKEYHVLSTLLCVHVKDTCVFLNMQQTLLFMVTVDEYLNLLIVWSVYLSIGSEFLNLKIIW